MLELSVRPLRLAIDDDVLSKRTSAFMRDGLTIARDSTLVLGSIARRTDIQDVPVLAGVVHPLGAFALPRWRL